MHHSTQNGTESIAEKMTGPLQPTRFSIWALPGGKAGTAMIPRGRAQLAHTTRLAKKRPQISEPSPKIQHCVLSSCLFFVFVFLQETRNAVAANH